MKKKSLFTNKNNKSNEFSFNFFVFNFIYIKLSVSLSLAILSQIFGIQFKQTFCCMSLYWKGLSHLT